MSVITASIVSERFSSVAVLTSCKLPPIKNPEIIAFTRGVAEPPAKSSGVKLYPSAGEKTTAACVGSSVSGTSTSSSKPSNPEEGSSTLSSPNLGCKGVTSPAVLKKGKLPTVIRNSSFRGSYPPGIYIFSGRLG